MPAPAAQPGAYGLLPAHPAAAARHRARSSRLLSDEFDDGTLGPAVDMGASASIPRPTASRRTASSGSTPRPPTCTSTATMRPVLVEPAPQGQLRGRDEGTRHLASGGCCFNYVQGGLVIYGDDDNFVKLVSFSNWETRQTEFAKEVYPVPEGYPRYGNTIVGPPGDWTWLRIVVSRSGEGESVPGIHQPGRPELGARRCLDAPDWPERQDRPGVDGREWIPEPVRLREGVSGRTTSSRMP